MFDPDGLLERIFRKKMILKKKNQQITKKHEKLPSGQRVKLKPKIVFHGGKPLNCGIHNTGTFNSHLKIHQNFCIILSLIKGTWINIFSSKLMEKYKKSNKIA